MLTVRIPLNVCGVGRIKGGDERVGGHIPHLDAATQVPEASHHENITLGVEQGQVLQRCADQNRLLMLDQAKRQSKMKFRKAKS